MQPNGPESMDISEYTTQNSWGGDYVRAISVAPQIRISEMFLGS